MSDVSRARASMPAQSQPLSPTFLPGVSHTFFLTGVSVTSVSAICHLNHLILHTRGQMLQWATRPSLAGDHSFRVWMAGTR